MMERYIVSRDERNCPKVKGRILVDVEWSDGEKENFHRKTDPQFLANGDLHPLRRSALMKDSK